MGKRGEKICKKCKAPNGPRAFRCKACNASFDINRHGGEKKNAVLEWTELEKGQYIKVLAGSGPYWQPPNSVHEEDRMYMGYHGIFSIFKVLQDGLLTIKATGEGRGGIYFIYMGPVMRSKQTGCYRQPHMIVKVKRKVKQ